MSILIQDEATTATLSAMSEPSDVFARDGRLLGQFIPMRTGAVSFPEIGLTDRELETRLADPSAKWHTPEQVMARLQELRKCSH